MKLLSHAVRLCAVLCLGFLSKPAIAETSSGSTAASSAETPKTSAKSGEQSGTKTSAASNGSHSDTAKNPAAAAAGEAGSAPAPKVVPQGPVLFKLIDTNKDGRVSSAEFIAYGKSAEGGTTTPAKTTLGAKTRSDSATASPAVNAKAKSDAAQASRATETPAAKSEVALPDTGIPISTSSRASKHTAEVFEILDIDHDKFLSRKELDVLSGGAHQISQP